MKLLPLLLFAASAFAAGTPCGDLARLALPDATITSAQAVPAGPLYSTRGPADCRCFRLLPGGAWWPNLPPIPTSTWKSGFPARTGMASFKVSATAVSRARSDTARWPPPSAMATPPLPLTRATGLAAPTHRGRWATTRRPSTSVIAPYTRRPRRPRSSFTRSTARARRNPTSAPVPTADVRP